MNAQQPILVKTDQAHLEIDVEYARAVLERFSNPWHRYLLTLYLDATAEALQNSIATHQPPAITGARCDFGRGGGARELTPDEIGQFQRCGYVKLTGILSGQQVDALRGAAAVAVESLQASPNSYNVTTAADALWNAAAAIDTGGSTQHDLPTLARAIAQSDLPRLLDEARPDQTRGNFLLDTGVWRRVPGLAAFALASQLPHLSAELLNIASVRFFDDQIFIKEAGAIDRVAFHQDLAYFHLDGTAGCVFWIPLDPVRSGSGRMGYVPGSHLWGKLFKPNIFASQLPFPGSDGLDMPDIDVDPAAHGVEYVDVEPGDVLVHHLLTVHGSEGNQGGAPRRAISLRYIDTAMRYRSRPGAPPQPLHRADAKDGDPLDEAIHPVVWPPAPSHRCVS
jgi:Phytanoyl-CoA dioxygenase (PhyH)